MNVQQLVWVQGKLPSPAVSHKELEHCDRVPSLRCRQEGQSHLEARDLIKTERELEGRVRKRERVTERETERE